MQAKFRGKAQSDFPKRMFRYFARLTEKYDIPIYPVVIFSYDAPQRPEPDRYTVAFPNKTVLRFEYDVIQLNRLPWRRFVNQENPVASALMAKMKMSAPDRPKVKAQCLRLLASLKLDPAKSTLIGGFIDSYLELTAQEMKQYERELEQFAPAERKATMELMTTWGRIGKAEGRIEGKIEGKKEGKEELVVRILRRRFGSISAEAIQQLGLLAPEQLGDLGESLLDFTSITDLDEWLKQTTIADRLN
ncbi:hypothetical protein CCAX7_46910 [Capsulimonas corticalis]|uniref:Uncharacterized protein n=1 Tax=Capsulimonas corticalis TaxID=2219043 RepID=A0A402CQR2_9BACT|nr:DUF4351 domain-containing protein [Capsulimonas corticalis]BDI32640.1 hypothetical protein CCAX7_46910 [Capsulimonas corticalis]